ncbi:MAG: glycosyltransferase family 4 protein [Candidatus Margulisbacteria bacterium]|jgi:glycosyltransferase involved in cell wall biosynthesis|nr:glycosyltransferase family 4 protein [Candidatus Margulisiibacteriota bacterium]
MRKNKKTVTFLLPHNGAVPAGGFKVVYEYANRLSADGHDVNIVYPCSIDHKFGALRFIFYFFGKSYKSTWFFLRPEIKEILTPSLAEKYIPDSDVVIATGWKTAEKLAEYKNTSSRRKFYLIQGYEDWQSKKYEWRLINTWKSNLRKIVIAPWLQKIAIDLDQKSTLIENGLDFNYFHLIKPIKKRAPYNLCLLYHPDTRKGFDIGWQAVQIVHKKYPEARVSIFGAYRPLLKFPNWVVYYYRPPKNIHNRLYNKSAIFIAPSRIEGFGLTPAEAMQCGCAVVCTDTGGFRVFCQHGKTALVSPVDNIQALASNIIKLIENPKLRIRLAKNGNKYIQKFTWERAYKKLKTTLGLL